MLSPIDYSHHARAKAKEAAMFWPFSNRPPIYEGLVRMHIVRELEKERHGDFDANIKGLLRASASRLSAKEGGKDKWSYTRRHSLEVGFMGYLIAGEAVSNRLPEAAGLDPKLAFAGGFIHDIGKTFLPLSLVVKELGVEFDIRFVHFCLLEGKRMTSVERNVLRNEHVAAGTRYVRLFGAGEHIRTMLDMVGLHHVMYNGEDSLSPSYPSQVRGMDLPFQARVAKVADFISATLPRHYREGEWVETVDHAVAYAIAVAGRELDPLAVRCVMTGIYRVSLEETGRMLQKLGYPYAQADLADFQLMRRYVSEVVGKDPDFLRMIKSKDRDKTEHYRDEINRCAQEYGIRAAVELPK